MEEKLGKNVSWKPKELQCLKEEMEVTCAGLERSLVTVVSPKRGGWVGSGGQFAGC